MSKESGYERRNEGEVEEASARGQKNSDGLRNDARVRVTHLTGAAPGRLRQCTANTSRAELQLTFRRFMCQVSAPAYLMWLRLMTFHVRHC